MGLTEHSRLVGLGAAWLRRNGFGVVATELRALGCAEEADAIGFRSTCSAVIEAKVSRADFLADQKKPHRGRPGLGVYRFFVSPPGIIEPHDLPVGWGLLHASGRSLRAVVAPPGNLWPPYGAQADGWTPFHHKPDDAAERHVLYSIARRLAKRGGVVG